MMALAIHLQGLVDSGKVADYAELARLGEVSRARLTQIMDLTLLAPDIQEAVLFLPAINSGRDPLSERKLRRIAASPIWDCQREQWSLVCAQGFTEADRDDIEQEFRLDLLRRSKFYDPDKSSPATFANRVLTHRCASLIEERLETCFCKKS